MSVFNNVPVGTSRFKVVRLDSSTAGHILNLRLLDLGDATAPVTVEVLQPDSDAVYGACFGVGPSPGTRAPCKITTTAATHGGHWQTLQVPIPDTYHCSADGDQSACWVRVRLTTSAGQADTTTWSATLDGDPVRIVPDAP